MGEARDDGVGECCYPGGDIGSGDGGGARIPRLECEVCTVGSQARKQMVARRWRASGRPCVQKGYPGGGGVGRGLSN